MTTMHMPKLPLIFVALRLLACCRAACTNVRLTIRTDKYPGDISWELKNSKNGQVKWSGNGYSERYHDYVETACMQNKKYDFTISDSWGPGLCCQYGEGFYKLETQHDGEWKTLLHGGRFSDEETSVLRIGEKKGKQIVQGMTWWEKSLLAAHNSRRLRYHEDWDTDYVPLKWSPELQKRSQAYAEISAQECKEGIPARHGEVQEYGENVLGNSGRTGSSWAEFKTANGYLTQFVEREDDWDWPQNGHESMAMWRATQYVGCGNSTIHWTANNGKPRTCHRLVCRYAKPGNCMAPNFDWEREAKKDTTFCGPMCPPEGCFHADAPPEPSTPYPE